jgi:hypothetical protein
MPEQGVMATPIFDELMAEIGLDFDLIVSVRETAPTPEEHGTD